MALIKIDHLSKFYGEHQVLFDVSLTIENGSFISIFGPSGCGKSTLLSILGLVERADNGSYELLGQDIRQLNAAELSVLRRKHLGFIFQNFNLIDHLSNKDNIALPLLFDGVRKKDAWREADILLEQLGMQDHGKKYPWQLSGGQQQRIAIARALIAKPKLLLVDEPTGNLDSKTGTLVMELLQQLNQQGCAVVLVTHELSHAQMADQIIHLHDGKIIQNKELPDDAA